jgi:hypothetical protein
MATEQAKTTTAVNRRAGAGTQFASLTSLPAGTPVTIVADTGDWLQVEAAGRQGFLSERFVAREASAIPPGLNGVDANDPFPDIALAPAAADCIQCGARATSAEKLVATTWNKAGCLLSTLAGRMKFDTGAAVAVFCTESGGNGFQNGRMLIRFENHHFDRHWGKAHPQIFADHFRYNAQKPWTAHQWRASTSAGFETVHTDQSSEWRCFEFASTLDPTAARLSISMGGPQILGSNFADAGFESVDQMFDAFTAGEKRQVIAFFDFLQGHDTHPPKILALQQRDFTRFAELYNGPGNAAEYGSRLSLAFDAFQRLRPTAAAAKAG